jgi:hypothetical protein
MHMPNFNDAKITSLYVNAGGAVADIQDDAPNASTPGGPFDVTLEMVAGTALSGAYNLVTTCVDLTTSAVAPASLQPGAPLNGTTDTFGSPANWKSPSSLYNTFNQTDAVSPPAGAAGHVYQYTAALFTPNGQIVSIKQSEPFILL